VRGEKRDAKRKRNAKRPKEDKQDEPLRANESANYVCYYYTFFTHFLHALVAASRRDTLEIYRETPSCIDARIFDIYRDRLSSRCSARFRL